ncbi:hypothetical protein [Ruminococcus sp.]|uniref:hypothetical protein n=1 Tax=Ruminococcus sp. TaxID=41978 RepID=UPI00388CF25A
MNLNSASNSVRLNMLINSIVDEAKNQHAELSEADLDRAIRILTLDSLDRIANSLEHIEKRMHQ